MVPELNLRWCACLSDASKTKGKWSVVWKGSVSESGEVMFVPTQPCDVTKVVTVRERTVQLIGKVDERPGSYDDEDKEWNRDSPPYQVPFLLFAGRIDMISTHS